MHGLAFCLLICIAWSLENTSDTRGYCTVAYTYDTVFPTLHRLLKMHKISIIDVLSFYTCMGASDKILDHCFCLNSAATTPLTLDPMGSPALLTRTQALSSNLTTLPSGRCHFFAVRTTTACRTSPRRTLFAALMDTLLPVSGPKFRCFLTTTTMRSPCHCQPYAPTTLE